jgi:hypothetical protein
MCFDVTISFLMQSIASGGEYGDGHVRFALVENEHRIRQATKGIKQAIQK